MGTERCGGDDGLKGGAANFQFSFGGGEGGFCVLETDVGENGGRSGSVDTGEVADAVGEE